MFNLKTIPQSFKYKLGDFFMDIYICERTWSGWSYNTMSKDDFYLLADDENFIETIIEILHLDKINDSIICEYIEDYEAHYNCDIENCFSSEYFDDCWLAFVDFDELVKYLNKFKSLYKIQNTINHF